MSAGAQTATPTQQAPAPVVRVRPHRDAAPNNAPADAAPLVNTAPRVRPVNPQALSGTVSPAPRPSTVPQAGGASQAATGTSAAAATTEAHKSTPATEAPDRAVVLARMAAPTLNRNVVVLDPAHGGTDGGSRIGDHLLEKTVTLAFAQRLRSLLAARGFTVVLTRDADLPATGEGLSLDDRAGIANHAGASACLFLHATGRGDGVHLYTTELAASPGTQPDQPWLTAQAPWVPASQQLEKSVSTALGRSHVALVSSAASIRPMDSLACPALILEIAPENGHPESVNASGYQDRIAGAVAGALVFWANQVQSPPRLAAGPATTRSNHRHHESTTPRSTAPATEEKP